MSETKGPSLTDYADAIERLAWSIPPANEWTPQLMMMAISMRQQSLRRRCWCHHAVASPTPSRPILLSGPMVRAIIGGTKTQTRRVINPQPYVLPELDVDTGAWQQFAGDKPYGDFRCPYGSPGDLLWVRESWARDGGNGYLYCATDDVHELRRKMPSIHMPRIASRLTLSIVGVRIERLQSIAESDAKAEGALRMSLDDDGKFHADEASGTFRCGFAGLWNHINGKRPGADWDANPYVWAISFKVHLCNVDQMGKTEMAA